MKKLVILLLFFVFKIVNGMEPTEEAGPSHTNQISSGSDPSSSSSHPSSDSSLYVSSPDDPEFNASDFSLVELTVLIRTLREIKRESFISEDNIEKPIHQIFEETAYETLNKMNLDNLNSDELINIGLNKIKEVIYYYNSMMNKLDIIIWRKIKNNKNNKIAFMEKRINQFYHTMSENNYYKLISGYNIKKYENLSVQQNLFILM
uniref:DUF148 domain-containing protein n=1 Tax=Meloidogyne hapla TaxID=6305 RepID=A0A1I8BLK1_MELHA